MTLPHHPSARPVAAARTPSSDRWLMVRKFLKHGTTIASFSPSSRFLSRAVVRGIDFDTAKVVVELGAGTGPITHELMRRVRSNTRCVIVEQDPDFCTRLRQKFPAADIVEGDAAHIDRILADRGIRHVDHVLSGLPLPSFPAELRDSIIHSSTRWLHAAGTFRQLTNMPWVYRGLYREYFHAVAFKLVTLNLPPGGVYVCTGYRGSIVP
jgi:phospholipid N-methyltransferase